MEFIQYYFIESPKNTLIFYLQVMAEMNYLVVILLDILISKIINEGDDETTCESLFRMS